MKFIEILVDYELPPAKCAICGEFGADVMVASYALGTGFAHKVCLEKEIQCEGCGKFYKAEDMVISYWNAFTWRCYDCEGKMI